MSTGEIPCSMKGRPKPLSEEERTKATEEKEDWFEVETHRLGNQVNEQNATIARLCRRLAFWEKHGTKLRNGAFALLEKLDGHGASIGDTALEGAADRAGQCITERDAKIKELHEFMDIPGDSPLGEKLAIAEEKP